MFDGLQLSLMVGPVVPAPVPRAVIDALTSVEVRTGGDTPSGFQLTFTLGRNSPLHALFLLAGGVAPQLVRVIIIVTVKGTAEVLMDGVMTHHQVTPGSGAGSSTLTVIGEDLTAVMDLIDFSGFPYPAMPPEARVALILAKYAAFGVVPMVIPSVLMEIPNPLEEMPRQQGTDLTYVNYLADDVGYVFHINPGPKPGMNVGYWGPEIKVGPVQTALNVDMDAHTNVESLSFSFDNQSKTLPILEYQNRESRMIIPLPIPDITPLNPPLGAITPLPNRVERVRATSRYSLAKAAVIAMTRAAKTAEAVTANGSLSVLRYGRVLKARQLVGVRGGGVAFDGLYYVRSVTHEIKRGEYRQSFSLSRNGLVSTVSRVAS